MMRISQTEHVANEDLKKLLAIITNKQLQILEICNEKRSLGEVNTHKSYQRQEKQRKSAIKTLEQMDGGTNINRVHEGTSTAGYNQG